MFLLNKTYKIQGKPFEYLGKVRDMMYYRFQSIDNPEDIRDVPIFSGNYARSILNGTA